MKEKSYLYTSGEFAKLNGINKRTLHYYHEIGLFSPAVVGENGYHYYTSLQIVQLELILTLRRLGLSIDDIKSYMSDPQDGSFVQIVAEKKNLIDQSIRQLLAAKAFLQKKSDKLELGLVAEHGKMELIHYPERRLLLSDPITGSYDEMDFSVAAAFSLRLKKRFGLYDNFGSRLSVERLIRGEHQQYDRFFAYVEDDDPEADEILPGGTYLRTFCIGGWDRLPEIYARILAYAREQGLTLQGFAYEEGLNELFLQNGDHYITMITVRCG